MKYPNFGSEILRKVIFIVMIALNASAIHAQTLEADMALELEVCQDPDTLSITLYNDGSQSLSALTLEVILPSGVEYVEGSKSELTSKGLQLSDFIQFRAATVQRFCTFSE